MFMNEFVGLSITERINLPLFDLLYDKVEEPICHYIDLNKNHLVWILQSYLCKHPKPEDNLGIIKPNQYCNTNYFILKSSIFSIESNYSQDCDVWVLNIYYGNQICDCKFETESEMRIVENKLQEWLTK